MGLIAPLMSPPLTVSALRPQLIRRNDELTRVYEKIKLQQCTLAQGEAAYNERLADHAALQKDCQLLRAESIALKSAITNLEHSLALQA